jgi:hypothetical protein
MGLPTVEVVVKETVSRYVFPTVRIALLRDTEGPPPAEIPVRAIVLAEG